MTFSFTPEGWKDFEWWMDNDKQALKKVRRLIDETRRTPREGSGKPERLKHFDDEVWSRRITQEHRFVYGIDKDGQMTVLALRFHYE